MTTAQQRGWGDPDSAGYRTNHIVKVQAGGVTLYVRREVAHLFAGFCDELVARGYRLDVNADDWGYNNRDIRGRPGVKSNHAWGLAIDLNSGTNPMTSDGRVHTDMPPWVRESAHYWGLFWGAEYSGTRKDPMHFEYLGTPNDVPHPVHRYGTTPAPVPSTTEDETMLPRVMHWNGAIFLVGYDYTRGPWRRTFPNPSRLAQIVGGGGCVTDNGNAFEVTNNQFMTVYVDLGTA